MSMIGVDYGVLNQRGSPSWFSDIYANIPTAGYKGRMFISTDTFAFYRDTGTGWDLIGGPGTGTITGSGASGQVSFFNGSSTLAGNNNLFWDSTNNRLGIGTATPGVALDIHATGTNAQFNGTGTNNAYLVFQNSGTSKWRIGNTYNAGANSFDIYNNSLSANAISISSANLITTSSIFCNTSFTSNGTFTANSNINITNGAGITTGAGYNVISTDSTGFFLVKSNSTNWAYLSLSNLTAPRNFTFPDTTGTFALTSDLSSYLPLSGGSLTGNLSTNSYISIQNGLGTNQIYLTKSSGDVYGTIQTKAGGNSFALGVVSNIGTLGTPVITWNSGLQVGINNSSPSYDFDVTGGLRSTTTSYLATSSGSVAIGTTSSPLSKLQVVSALGTIMRIGEQSGTTGKQMLFGVDSTTGRGEIQAVWQGTANTPLGLNVAGGNVLVGTITDAGYKLNVSGTGNFSGSLQGTSANFSTNIEIGTTGLNGKLGIYSGFTSKVGIDMRDSDDASNAYFLYFRKSNGGGIGSIQRAGLTDAVLYNTTSDYRLKEDYKEIKGLEKILLIKVYDFKWKGIKDRMDGVIAHELQEILPYAVSGIKDGIDYQSVDYSKLVPILVKSIQELNDKLVRNNIN